MDRRLEVFRHSLADGSGDELQARPGMAVELPDDHQPLVSLALDGERRPAAWTERGVGALGHQLDVLRIQVAPAQDDQVLEPAGDEQVAAG